MLILISFFALKLLGIGFETTEMNPLHQQLRKIITIQEIYNPQEVSFTYGIWSKYNPLGKTNQVGLYGLFDGYCFHLHNALEKDTLSLNFIYYDCLDKQQKTIKKIIQFINDKNEQLKFEINIDALDYDDIWYFMQIIQWPQLDRFELIIIKQQLEQIHEIIQMKRPYSDKNLILTFGSNLIVQQMLISLSISNSKLLNIKNGDIFSYFPGTIRLQEYIEKILSPTIDLIGLAQESYQSFKNCICQINEKIQFDDFQFSNLQQIVYISPNSICDSFVFMGWVKIKQILSEEEEINYQFLKISSISQNLMFQDQNIIPFQLFYYIKGNQYRIEITTYSYSFPEISINFLESPYLIRDYFIIANITLWHYIRVELKSNKFTFDLTFYEHQDVNHFQKDYNVNQFKNYKLKILYGNCQQQQSKLSVEIKNFQFYNCYKQLAYQNCHYSCLTCDGPTSENCLSCLESSQRIYLHKFKACICPYNTVDENGICQTYNDSNLSLLKTNGNNKQQCQQGYFEIENECQKCPSIIKTDLITCFDCFHNPINWQFELTCQNTLNLQIIGSIEDSLIPESIEKYYFDGSNLNYRNDYHITSNEREINKNENINLELELVSINFKHFCQKLYYQISNSVQCYLCKLENCLACLIDITGVKCTRCENSYILFNGSCIPINFNEKDILCLPPNYISYSRQCKQCLIKNCVYCFEYLSHDQNLCSLLSSYVIYENDYNNIKIGCALCEEHYIYDFTLNLCILLKPQLINCQRSYIDLDNKEICTLSTQDDFSIAPEILNCQKYIQYCVQCTLTIKSQIQCIRCQDDFIVENSQCFPNQEYQYQEYQINNRKNQIQSFMLQFIPILNIFQYQNYISPNLNIDEYCSADCLFCEQHSFYNCKQCPLNYFKKQIKVEKGKNCSDCPQLCQVCSSRSEIEIKAYSKSFVITQENAVFTKKCIKPYLDSSIYFDTINYVARYCFNQECNDSFMFKFKHYSCDLSRFIRNYEEQINTKYCNSIGVKSIDIDFELEIQDEQCFQNFPMEFSTKLKEKIFGLKQINFKMHSSKNFTLYPYQSIFFQFFDQVELNNLNFIIQNNQSFNLENDFNFISLKLINITISQSSFNNLDSLYQTKSFDSIYIANFTITDSLFNSSSVIKIKNQNLNGIIIIIGLFIFNSTFIDSTLFYISSIKNNIFIQNFRVENCFSQNSQIFYFATEILGQVQINISKFEIQNNTFQNSILINSTHLIELKIVDFKIKQNQLLKSIIIAINFKLELKQTVIEYNYFQCSQFIIIIQKLFYSTIPCLIEQIQAYENNYQVSNLFLIFSTFSSNNLVINIFNAYIYSNHKQFNQNESQYLFQISCDKLILNHVIIKQNQNLYFLFLLDNQYIQIDNLLYQGSSLRQKIPLQFSHFEPKQKNKLILIQGISNIQINNLNIEKLINFDESLIEISQSFQAQNNKNGVINFTNFNIQENIVLNLNLLSKLSLLSIESNVDLFITFQNISFRQNIFHSYVNHAIRISASLLYILSSPSLVEINNFLSFQNALTNSSNAFVIIESEKLNLTDFTIQNQNYLSKEIWKKYYELQLDDDQDQQHLNKFIFSTLKISNIGGAGKLHTSIMFCHNCFFENILAQEGFAFDITTSGQGFIKLFNLTINNAENDLESREKYTGCININSVNNQLNLNIKDATFFQIKNRMASSIFTILPSKIQNFLLFENIKIIDCVSLLNQIMNIQFSQLITHKNVVIIRNITIIQNLQIWALFFSKIKALSIQESNEVIKSENALISIQSSKIQLTGLNLEGSYISPIMKFENVPKLSIKLLNIQDIQIFYSFALIQIIQVLNIKSIIKFEQISISSVAVYETSFQESCQEHYLNENLILLQQNKLEISSIINIISYSNYNLFYFHYVKLMNNNCQHCRNGLIFFEVENFQKIIISNLNCLFNVVKRFGCLYFSKKKFDNSKIILKNSNFLFNKGTQGIAITCLNIYMKIINSKIINNFASELGGGIYYAINQSNFIINQSIIISNNARAGGGIYLQGNNYLNKNNFIQTLLMFNKATEQGNNLIELPSHLALFINSKEIHSLSQKINNIQNNIIKLKKYQILEQDVVKQLEDLVIPSNQIIEGFKIFDVKQSRYKLFIDNIYLYYKNSRNELLKNYFNSTCQINQSILSKSQSLNEQLKKSQILKFDNERYFLDISSLTFRLDPYKQQNEYLLIEILCKINEQDQGLIYKINAKSLKCQLGEFYVNEGCSICQSNQGFYSVTYNATLCSIFDKSKFQNITSNKIELLPGFWRPHNLSDFTEKCFKNSAFCKGGWFVGDDLCKNGNIGALCEECDNYDIRGFGNFYKNQWDQECSLCSGTWNGIFSMVLVIIWTFISIVLTLRSVDRSNKLYVQLKVFRRFNKILFKLNQDHESILLKMMINYLWNFSLIFSFNISFSFSLLFIEQTSNSSYSIASDLDCQLLTISRTPLIYLKLLLMIIFIVSQFNVIFLATYFYSRKIKHKYDLSILTNSILYLYIVNYAGLIKMLSSILSIRKISNINYMQGDVSIVFGENNHKSWMLYFVLPWLLFIGLIIPVYIFFFLLANRKNLDKIKLRKHLCYILNEYQNQSYFWEQIKQFKKAIIIFIMTYFETQILFKATLLGLCLLIYQLIVANQKPFVIQKFNSMDLQAGQICSITIFLAAIKYICEQQSIQYASFAIQISIIGFFIRLCYPFIFQIFRIYYKTYKIIFLTRLYNLLTLISTNFILTVYINKMLIQQKEKEQRLQEHFMKLRDYLILYTKFQLRNSIIKLKI